MKSKPPLALREAAQHERRMISPTICAGAWSAPTVNALIPKQVPGGAIAGFTITPASRLISMGRIVRSTA